MNKYILLAILIASSAVDAVDPVVRSKDHTCVELRNLVMENGSIVLTGFWGSQARVYPTRDGCQDVFDERAVTSNWRTSDKRFCKVGYICEQFWRGGDF